MSLLVSASETLKIWDCVDNTLSHRFTFTSPSGENSTFASWNHTNQVVATGGGRHINLVHVAQQGHLLSTIPFSESETIDEDLSCIAFSQNSRYIASGVGENVLVWDLKRRSLKATLSGHRSRISAVSFFQEGDIAVGDEYGVLRIWNSKNVPSDELVPKERVSSSIPLTALGISALGAPKVATGAADGYLCVWDPVALSVTRRQSVGPRAITGVSFSPKNARLVATSGLDGRMALIDTTSKSSSDPSASVDIGEGLTAICFHQDAIHCAVGTESGHILMYDWRNIRKPIFRVEAHASSPVQALAFQGPVSSAGSSTPARDTATPGSERNSDSTVASSVSKSPSHASPRPSAAAAASASMSVGGPSSIASGAIPRPTRSSSPSSLPVTQQMLRKQIEEGLVTLPTDADRRRGQRQPQHDSLASSLNTSMSTLTDAGMSSPPRGRGSISSGAGIVREAAGSATAPSAGPSAASVRTVTSAQPASVDRRHVSRADSSRVGASAAAAPGDEFEELRRAVQPVTSKELQDSLQLLKYDMHKEMQAIIKEQNRLFAIAKEDNEELVAGMTAMLQDLVAANKALREENERLRRIY